MDFFPQRILLSFLLSVPNTNSFLKGPDCKCFRFCRPFGPCCNYSTLPLWPSITRGFYDPVSLYFLQEWVGEGGQDLICGHGLQTPVLDDHQLSGRAPQSIKGAVLPEPYYGFPQLYLIRVPNRSQWFLLQE